MSRVRQTELYPNSDGLVTLATRHTPESKIIRADLNLTPKWLAFDRFLISIEGTNRY